MCSAMHMQLPDAGKNGLDYLIKGGGGGGGRGGGGGGGRGGRGN